MDAVRIEEAKQDRPALLPGGHTMHLLLWILALLIGIWGVVTLIRGQVLLGIILIIVAFLVGPGGVSVFN